MNGSREKVLCLWCGVPSNIIWVHGHGQCSNCGVNSDECCKGEICNQPVTSNKSESDLDNTSDKKDEILSGNNLS